MAQYAEGQRLKGSDGRTYVVRNGVPVVDAPSPLVTDPRLSSQVAVAQGQAAAAPYAAPRAQADAATAQAEAQIRGAQAPVAPALAEAQRDQAVAEAQKAQIELQKLRLGNQLDPEKRKAIDALQQQIDRVNLLFQRNIEGGLPNPIFGHIPTPGNTQFRSAAQGLVNPFQAAFRVPGQGSQSDIELQQFQQGGVPMPTDTDAEIQEKLRNLQTRLTSELGQQPTASTPLPPIGAQTSGMGQTSGPTRARADPVLQAVGGRVGAMLSSGAPDSQIVDFLKQSGVDPANTNIQQALQFRQTPAFKQWQRVNPGQAYPIGPEFYTKQVPMSAARQLFNRTAQTDLGGDAAAGIVAAGNSLTGNRGAQIVGAINGDPGAAQMGMNLLRQNHPVSSLVGDVAGQGLTEAALGTIPGARALMATKMGRRGADALFGGYYGSGGTDDPLSGGLEGAALNVGGGMFGRGIQKGAGRALSGVKNPHLQYLDNRGVPLTVGQIARGSENTVGHAIGGIEERMAGLPIADAIIGSARKRGDEGFNREMFGQIAPGVTSSGAEGLAQARAAEQAAYAKLNPVRIGVDPEFGAALDSVANETGGLLHHAGDVSSVIGDIRAQINNGEITGKGYQTALQAIRSTRASLNDDVGGKAKAALDALEGHIMGLGERQGGQIGQDLSAANAIHSRIKIVEDALKKSPSQRNDELISPMTLNQSAIRNTEKFGGAAKALSPQRQFYDLTDAGKAVMPNLTPDSGTAGRAILYSTLLGGGLGGGVGFAGADQGQGGEGGMSGASKGAAIAAALSLPYSKAGQKIIQKTLLGDRPNRIVKIGDYLINQARMGGMFGSAMGRQYLPQ